MKTTEFKVLLIDHSGYKNKLLIEILNNFDLIVVTVNTIESAIQKAISFSPDLIICQEEFGEYTGFQVYNMLEKEILRNGIPFILMLSDYNKHSIMMGEELGIDGFIFPPYEADKIFNILRTKIRKFRAHQLRTLRYFKKLYELIPLGIFVAENRRIVEANKYLHNLINNSENHFPDTIESLLDFDAVPEEKMKVSRILNGLNNNVCICSIPLRTNSAEKYDVNLFYLENGLPGLKIVGLLVPLTSIINFQVKNESNGDEKQIKSAALANTIFTRREQQVLELSEQGMPIKLIADQLKISERTVEKHRSNILRKTNTGNIIEALFFVKKQNVIAIP